MIDFTDPSTANLRLSNSERDDAISMLVSYASEGRLSDSEAAERSAKAREAVTRGDLAPLFADLPPARGAGTARREPGDGSAEPFGWFAHRPAARVTVALMPFVALILFFITGNIAGFSYAWLWFLLIPIAGILVYGVGEHDRRR